MTQADEGLAGNTVPDPDSPHLEALNAATVERRRAEARGWAAMLAHQDQREREFAVEGLSGEALSVARSTVPGEIARVLNCSERHAAVCLSTARQVRRDLPTTWTAFCRGLLERAAVSRIAETADHLAAAAGASQPDVLEAFDAAAAEAAVGMTLPRLGPWLKRYLARLSPEAAEHRAQQARADRWVRVTHGDDGMSLLEAHLPTLTAAAIARRLSAVARSTDSPIPHQDERGRRLDGAEEPPDHSDDSVLTRSSAGPAHNPGNEASADPEGTVPGPSQSRAGGDPRTLAQREADLFGAWLLSGRIDGVEVDAKIAVMIPEATLRGESEAPGLAADGSYTFSAQEARRLAAGGLTGRGGRHDWYEARFRPVPHTGPNTEPSIRPIDPGTASAGPGVIGDGLGPSGMEADLLSVVSTGRSPSKRLRDALIFRDGTCRAPGCTVPAERCDLDHQTPYPAGATTADNLWALCRRHHRMKSHGYLSPPAPPPDAASRMNMTPGTNTAPNTDHMPELTPRRHTVDLLWAVTPHRRRAS
ncbi:HNH endonuclease signature motif containing protein [Nesterenkonia aerolata]|uniref:DUF222 domain-containing protein n=1 Tax=Nesterenkonia aerolata TaxID=3074079 RepID=A0ABU2DP83_9MICC|nr:DUF222 domain-containing protein [Nesterenkonia sp. LY-0111]MDR8018332.1 DUF222 domain-containing protein [Nesterenkonia sp. LY-0111]